MKLQIGADIVHVPRIASLLSNDTAVARTFKPDELRDKDPSHLAGIFAAKESVFKALGIAPSWLDVKITKSPDGKPSASISKQLGHAKVVDISISHDGDYAVAFVILEID
ncbi:MAG: holo-ACP synthase [Nanoarchaeota archaeon]